MTGPRILIAVAAASGRIGYICFHEGRPTVWLVSRAASKSPEKAAEYTQRWINEHEPHFFITECLKATRKGGRTVALTEAMQRIAAHNYLHDVTVKPSRVRFNKYDEGKRLAKKFPELAKRLPTVRHFYDSEPKNTVLIDALLLAEAVFDGPDLPLPSPLPAGQS